MNLFAFLPQVILFTFLKWKINIKIKESNKMAASLPSFSGVGGGGRQLSALIPLPFLSV